MSTPADVSMVIVFRDSPPGLRRFAGPAIALDVVVFAAALANGASAFVFERVASGTAAGGGTAAAFFASGCGAATALRASTPGSGSGGGGCGVTMTLGRCGTSAARGGGVDGVAPGTTFGGFAVAADVTGSGAGVAPIGAGNGIPGFVCPVAGFAATWPGSGVPACAGIAT
jgi:hypothetical protein